MRTPWVRLVLAISLDGRLAPPGGGAAQLGGPCDRRALEMALAWADGALIGAGTLRAHRSTCLIRDRDLLQERSMAGREQQPIAVVVSRQSEHPGDWLFFQQPIHRWLLNPKCSTLSSSLEAHPPLGFERCIRMEGSWAETLQGLATEGLSRLVLLGGAQLIASLLQEDRVDELQLTLTPRLLAGDHCWLPSPIAELPASLGAADAWHLQLAEQLGDNELLLRYRRNRLGLSDTSAAMTSS